VPVKKNTQKRSKMAEIPEKDKLTIRLPWCLSQKEAQP
jgi:hypothetical protein